MQLPSLGYQYASATVTHSIATIKSTNFSKFEQFYNVADEITSEIISSFQESNLQFTYNKQLSLQVDDVIQKIQFKKS